MMRVGYFGLEIKILEALTKANVFLEGVYLPPAQYWIRKNIPKKIRSRGPLKRIFKTAATYGLIYDFIKRNKVLALKHSNVNSRQIIHAIQELDLDLGIVSNFDQIIGTALLTIPRYGFINMHPSLLPAYRGPDPLGHILRDKQKQSGITWYQMSTKIDSGDILTQQTFTIAPDDTIKDIGEKSIDLAIKALYPLLEAIENEQINPIPQNEAHATYYSRRVKFTDKGLC